MSWPGATRRGSPPLVERIAIGRAVTADEVAAVVTFLASPLSVAITGESIATGGGTRGPIHY